uniref:Potassium channel tetramerisation-type BTB domain-containing protein n=1 Tax=Physcomitrium patens TaxID=3218 RepID=A0A2K1IZ60_PHYPA|nr:hypothetical protein PHYPA_024380 [Physcomitrium patens]
MPDTSFAMENFEIQSVVHLNSGGTMIATTVDTLIRRDPDSMLVVVFGWPPMNIFFQKDRSIDRDGSHFRHILNWLLEGVIPMLEIPVYQELLREPEYYQIKGLVENISPLLSKKDEDDNTKQETSH